MEIMITKSQEEYNTIKMQEMSLMTCLCQTTLQELVALIACNFRWVITKVTTLSILRPSATTGKAPSKMCISCKILPQIPAAIGTVA